MIRVLAINPGATSTKFAVFENDKELHRQTINHHLQELRGFINVIDQFQYRLILYYPV